jgi:hypothetical protein
MAKGDAAQKVGVSLRFWVFLAVTVVFAVICVWAEGQNLWYLAQGAFIGALATLVLGAAIWSHEQWEKRDVAPGAEIYFQALRFLLLALEIGVVGVLIIAVGKDHWQHGIVARSAGTSILFAGATFAIGVLFGFLFGFPPTPSSSAQAAAASSPAQNPVAPPGALLPDRRAPSVFQNTNLHEVSDWLTKVILGAGLVDLTRLPPQVEAFAIAMATWTNPQDPSPAVSLSILGYFSACGILFGYVWTRFEVLSTSHPPDRDADALHRVDRWLNQPPSPKDDVDRLAMTIAIKSASSGARLKIFLDTEKYRAVGSETVNARSLPIFEALTEADAQEIFHRIRSQNAFAIMGRKKADAEAASGDWKAALGLLNDAIRIRDRAREPGWHEYEFARAVCRIRLDEHFSQKLKSAPDVQAAILSDLDQSVEISAELRVAIDPNDPNTKEGVTTTWKSLNE